MKNILIVDDEVQICEMMADLFESRGFNVSIAHSGNEGAKCFKDSSFDLVVSDVRMPDGDGFSLAHQISEIDPSFDKIVFVTGFLDAETTEVPSNVRKFFKKPVRFKELIGFIEELLA
ncbi:response regulator [Halobacteriovorax sp.]|uniref:response regulator n=1 Tax=Halobacteriovorax sp. TaxID=2020862 RepID=UPI0035685CAD